MSNSMTLHDQKYRAAKESGLPGWGGVERISALPESIRERFLAYEGVPKSGRLLELGCGAGNLSLELAKMGYDVSGVDFSETAVTWAKENATRENLSVDFQLADVSDLSAFLDGSFDILYDGNCLHCILGQKRKVALAEWKRVLKADGILFISSLTADKEQTLYEAEIPYRYVPTPALLESELMGSGFTIMRKFIRSGTPLGHINLHAMPSSF